MADGGKRAFGFRGRDQIEDDDDDWDAEEPAPKWSGDLFRDRRDATTRNDRRGGFDRPYDRGFEFVDGARPRDQNWGQNAGSRNRDRWKSPDSRDERRHRDDGLRGRNMRTEDSDGRFGRHNEDNRRGYGGRDNTVRERNRRDSGEDDRRKHRDDFNERDRRDAGMGDQRRYGDGHRHHADNRRQPGGNERRRGGDGRRVNGPGRKIEVTIKFMENLRDRDPSDVLMTLGHSNTNFREALSTCGQEPKKLRLLLSVLAKAFSCSSADHHLIRVNLIMKEASFLNTAANYFVEMQDEQSLVKLGELVQSLKDMMTIMSEMAKKNPSCVTECLGVYSIIEMVINSLRQRSDVIDDDVLFSFKEFTVQKDKILKRNKTRDVPRYEDKDDDVIDPPNDFRDCPIFPQTADMQDSNDRYLRKNKVHGRYQDLDHYLDVQFRLLREDFIGPLRDGISNYIRAVQERGVRNHKIQEIRIYHSVQIISPVCTDSGLCHTLQFDVSRLGNIRWQSSKRLIYGSLICLSPDNFKTFFFATVTNREIKDLCRGLIKVRFEHGNETVKQLFGNLFTMAETTAYFESYRHVLSGLQRTQEGDLPFERYIINCQSDVKPPSYLNRNTRFDLRPLVDEDVKIKADSRLEQLGDLLPARQENNFSKESEAASAVQLLDRTTWPPADLLHLDESQFKAIHTALTKEFVITQGPPGTGKTYIGLKIVKALLHNRKAWTFNPVTLQTDSRPMLIVCYTNHALDQFLEGIVKFFEGDLVRVGGRSSSDILKNYNLHNFRMRFRHAQKVPVQVYQGRRDAKNDMDSISEELNRICIQVEVIATNIVHEHQLQPFIGKYHFSLLEQQFQILLQSYQDAQYAFRPGSSIIVEWLGLGNLSAIVELEASMEQNVFPQGIHHEVEDEFIDIEDELDAIQTQRQVDFDDLSDDENMTKKQKDELHRQRVMAGFINKVALNVEKITDKKGKRNEEGWQQQAKERKRMKKNVQRNVSSMEVMSEEEAAGLHDLWRISIEQKWRLYRLWVKKFKDYLLGGIDEKLNEFEEASKRYQEALMQEDKEILKQSTVIGMTTSGAARYQAILQEIKPRIIVVEEAAEVLEAHVITTLSKGCEQLILIGDHKQLRPNPTVYKLAKDYNLDVSLFERMIQNKIQCDCLELQHRMRPEIAELMHHIYESLHDHEDVKKYPSIKGVAKNLFFINHSEPESDDADLRSHSNNHEAEYIVALCRYMLLQGYKPSQITVLTLYSGQLFTLKGKMPKEQFDGIRVTVVDSYQGEENDIILLSLVRSNEDGNIGFLKTQNRICVALSRAKMGLYVIGNFDLLADKSKLWNEIKIDMGKKNMLSDALQLYCQNHPDSDGIMARNASDFLKAPEGGCDKKCASRLKCGHTCEMFCHVQDIDHTEYHCLKKCNKIVCGNGHRCRKTCYESCGDCIQRIAKKLPVCGHIQQVPCAVCPDDFVCLAACEKMMSCGHKCQNICGNACTKRCEHLVEKRWSCGHKGMVKCSDSQTAVCTEPCTTPLNCDHLCKGSCGKCLQGRLHQPCDNDCRRILVCGHTCTDICNRCPPCTLKCQNACVHSKCQKRCGELCTPCMEPCTWKCQHYKCTKLCSEPCDRPPCNKACTKRLACEHQCIGLCGEPCPTDCRICDKQKVTELLFGDEDEPDARFVRLTDCKTRCIVESNAMDHYMSQTDEDDAEIALKACPKCKTPIRRCVRYGSIINRQLDYIEKVKARVLSNKRRIRELEEDIRDEFQNLGDYDDRSTFKRRLNYLKEPKSEETLAAILNQLTFLKAIDQQEDEWNNLTGIAFGDDKRKGLQCLKTLKNWTLLERNNMTAQEASDAELEISRSRAYLEILLFQQRAKTLRKTFDSMMKTRIIEAEKILKGKEKYTEQYRVTVESCLADLKEIIPRGDLGITDDERLAIVQAMAMPKGHWFKCPNGHIYAIGDCGGATVESKCPECKATIGGGDHRLRDDNRFAGEMDEAAHPAWSQMANVENFDINNFL